MRWYTAPCGLHRYRRRVDACSVCLTARALTLDALSAYGAIPTTEWERRLQRREAKARQQKRRALKAAWRAA